MVRRPMATAFFVAVHPRRDIRMDYVVTARHCIDEAHSYGSLYIRFNLKNGQYVEVQTSPHDWYLHDTADVAAIPVLGAALPQGVTREDVDQYSISIESLVGPGPEYIYRGEVPHFGEHEIHPQVGHAAFFVGLFTEHDGQERNLPIARFGRISRMPETVSMKMPGDIVFHGAAYLIEFQSWGGNSGAPVFFQYPMVLQGKNEVDLAWVSGLMGIISGHYPIAQEAFTSGDVLGNVAVQLHSGLAVVTPADAVRQLPERGD